MTDGEVRDGVPVCSICYSASGKVAPLTLRLDDTGTGEWVCPDGHVCGVRLDSGTLDLGAVRAAAGRNDLLP